MFVRGFGLLAAVSLLATIAGHAASLAGVPGVDVFRWASTATSFVALGALVAGLLYRRSRQARLWRKPARQAHAVGGLDDATASALDAALLPLVTSARVIGLAVAVAGEAGPGFRAYGRSGSPRPVDESTIFEVGSVTKTFTALVLAQMALEGQVGLDEPVAALLPGVKLRRGGREATVLDLATHHAGVSRIPLAMFAKVYARAPDPYASWDEARLERWARRTRATSTPGTRFSYSNAGFALLGLALARRAREPYAELVRRRVLEPLAMNESGFATSPADAERAAHGHDAFGGRAAAWNMAAFAPAGGLRSTARDMARYLDANLHPDRSPLAAAIEFAQEPRREVRPALRARLRLHPATAHSRIGLAWITSERDGGEVRWHNGSTGGFGSFVGMRPGSSQGVAALSNSVHTRKLDLACMQALGSARKRAEPPRSG